MNSGTSDGRIPAKVSDKHRITAPATGSRSTTRTAASRHAQRGLSILLFNNFLDVCGAHELSLFTESNDEFGLDGLVSSAALRVQELKQLLKCVGVRGIAEESAFALNAD
jgi:hypothetical protein